MLGRAYFTRQAATLLRWAKSISDPEAAAVLAAKAADLSSQAAEPSEDVGPRAADVEPESPDRGQR